MFKRPAYLSPGDTVGLLALASYVSPDKIPLGIEVLLSWGLNVVCGESLYAQHHQFAGTDQLRIHDFQTMLDNSAIKAIFSARGGYGCSRIIDAIDFKQFKKKPKWVIGFSDITVVHSQIHKLGIESLHAIMPASFGKPEASEYVENLKMFLFGETIPAYHAASHPLNREGESQGVLAGGNLCLLAHLIGSRTEINTEGKILFIEDVGEYMYNLDRMMLQLKRARKLEKLAGLIVGTFSDLKDNYETPFGVDAFEIIAEKIQDYHYPVCYDYPVGHTARNVAMPCGRVAQLSVANQGVLLQWSLE